MDLTAVRLRGAGHRAAHAGRRDGGVDDRADDDRGDGGGERGGGGSGGGGGVERGSGVAGRDGSVEVGAGAVAALDGGAAAARLDALIEGWSTLAPEGALTELVRVRGLLGAASHPGAGTPGDDLLAAAAARCDAVVEVLQTRGGSVQSIVEFRAQAAALRLWLDPGWPRTELNLGRRANAVALASAVVTGRVPGS